MCLIGGVVGVPIWRSGRCAYLAEWYVCLLGGVVGVPNWRSGRCVYLAEW